MKVLAYPRWEDFEYQYVNDNPNGWIGDGWAKAEKDKTISVDYLDDDQIDFPVPVTDDIVDDVPAEQINGVNRTNGVH